MPDQLGAEERVLIGVIVGSHGLQGTLKVDPKTDFPERFESLKNCWLVRSDGNCEYVTIKRCKFAPRGILLAVEGIRTREQADLLRGSTIEILMTERWALPEDSFYISDLEGCEAVDERGIVFGVIDHVIRGNQDVLSISSATGEILVPFVEEWVGDTDVVSKRVVIRRAAELFFAEEIPPALGESDH